MYVCLVNVISVECAMSLNVNRHAWNYLFIHKHFDAAAVEYDAGF